MVTLASPNQEKRAPLPSKSWLESAMNVTFSAGGREDSSGQTGGFPVTAHLSRRLITGMKGA